MVIRLRVAPHEAPPSRQMVEVWMHSVGTTVVNVRTSPCDVLIDRTTIFGNPFPEWRWGREECIKRFETYFYARLERDPVWKTNVLRLRGKVLGCHCAPLDCHGRIYVEFLDAYDEVQELRGGR